MTAFERDGTEVEALLTDLYLERVLARHGRTAAQPTRTSIRRSAIRRGSAAT
jgi:hypothetical protein